MSTGDSNTEESPPLRAPLARQATFPAIYTPPSNPQTTDGQYKVKDGKFASSMERLVSATSKFARGSHSIA